jgi:hypothetical protein
MIESAKFAIGVASFAIGVASFAIGVARPDDRVGEVRHRGGEA